MSPTALDGLLLGLVQGLTEFLPISSSGHLLLAEDLLSFRPSGVAFEVGLHVATLLAVLVAYRARVSALSIGLVRRDPEAWRYAGLLILGSIPAAVVGVGFRDPLAALFEPGLPLGILFLLTAAALWSTRWTRPHFDRLTAVAALTVGLAQAVAILPAVSRSGLTIAAAMWMGVLPVAAAEFSFMLAVIAIAGSGLLELRHLPPDFSPTAPGFLLAFLAALVSGVWAIRFLVALLGRGKFHHFAWYCAALGLLAIVWYGVAG